MPQRIATECITKTCHKELQQMNYKNSLLHATQGLHTAENNAISNINILYSYNTLMYLHTFNIIFCSFDFPTKLKQNILSSL